MTPHPPYYFLDFWALVIIGVAVFAFVRSRHRRRSLHGMADARPGGARRQAGADGGASGTASLQGPGQSGPPRDPH